MESQAARQGVPKRGRPARAGLREHLLQHTLKVLLRDGYESFSMNSVAVSARASKETLYRIFRDRTGLLKAALDDLGALVEPLLLQRIHEGLEPGKRLLRLAENYVDGCILPESLALQRIAYADDGKELAQAFAGAFPEAALAVTTRQMSDLGSPSPKLDAEIFLAMVQGQVRERVLLGVDGAGDARKRRRVAAHAVRIFGAYLGAGR